MYDDIANNSENPRPGIIINRPNGSDVYAGVPKVGAHFHCQIINQLLSNCEISCHAGLHRRGNNYTGKTLAQM